MSDARDVVTLLSEAERELAKVPFPLEADVRIMTELQAQSPLSRSWVPTLSRALVPLSAFAAGALAMILMHGSAPVRPDESHSQNEALVAETREAERAGFSLEAPGCTLNERDGHLMASGPCTLTLAVPTLCVETSGTTELVREPDGVRVVRGLAAFHVQPVSDHSKPVRVQVSAGAIRVLGTRFVVFQGDTSGYVDLLEGEIAFDRLDGSSNMVARGERYPWDNSTNPGTRPSEKTRSIRAPGVESGVSPQTSAPPAEGLDEQSTEIIEKVTQLRARHQYQEAGDVLEAALSMAWSPRAAEVLSFELGNILESHLSDQNAACDHWRQHLARFPDGRFRDKVLESLERMACD